MIEVFFYYLLIAVALSITWLITIVRKATRSINKNKVSKLFFVVYYFTFFVMIILGAPIFLYVMFKLTEQEIVQAFTKSFEKNGLT